MWLSSSRSSQGSNSLHVDGVCTELLVRDSSVLFGCGNEVPGFLFAVSFAKLVLLTCVTAVLGITSKCRVLKLLHA